MRMLKVAMILLVLVSFVAAVGIITMAATVSPTMMPMTGDRGMSDMRPLPKEMTMMPNTTMGMPMTRNVPMSNATMKAPTTGTPTMKASGMGNAPVVAPNMGNATMMPAKKSGMLIGLSEMQSNIRDVFKTLKNTTGPKSMSSTGAGLTGMANKMMGSYMGKT